MVDLRQVPAGAGRLDLRHPALPGVVGLPDREPGDLAGLVGLPLPGVPLRRALVRPQQLVRAGPGGRVRGRSRAAAMVRGSSAHDARTSGPAGISASSVTIARPPAFPPSASRASHSSTVHGAILPARAAAATRACCSARDQRARVVPGPGSAGQSTAQSSPIGAPQVHQPLPAGPTARSSPRAIFCRTARPDTPSTAAASAVPASPVGSAPTEDAAGLGLTRG